MDQIIDGLYQMFFELKVVNIEANPKAVLVFAFGCAIVGVFAVLLDISLFFLRGQSLLKLKHGKNSILFIILWSFGAFVIGVVGQMAKIFLVSLSACVFIGMSWPIILNKILKIAEEAQSKNDPVQPIKGN